MSARTIQVPMQQDLLEKISKLARERFGSRAAFIRAACEHFVRSLERAEEERRYLAGYARLPDNGHVAAAGVSLTAETLPDEDWS